MERNFNELTNSGDLALVFTIAFVFVCLASMIIDKMLGLEAIDIECKYEFDLAVFDLVDPNKPETAVSKAKKAAKKVKEEKCNAMRKDYNDKYFAYMMIVGVLTTLIGTYVIYSTDPTYVRMGAGLSLSGLFSIIYVLTCNWYNISTNQKILVLAIALAVLIYGSVKLL